MIPRFSSEAARHLHRIGKYQSALFVYHPRTVSAPADVPQECPIVREPLHAITAGRIEERIRAGQWAPGDRLPPERALCRDLEVSRATLRQALGAVAQRGLITREQGRGTFVANARARHAPAASNDGSPGAGRLRDHVILVTGSTGIAAAGARRFASEGARVFVTSRTADHCARLVGELSDGGADAAFATAELTDERQVDAAITAAVARFGRLDGLFAVAGGSGRRYGDGPLHEVTLDGWRQTLDLNLTSQFLVARAVLRQLLGQEPNPAGTRGALLLVGSVLARHPVPELFATHAYAAAKGATEALVTTMAAFYAPLAIRVNAMTPGLVATPMSTRAAEDRATTAFAARKQPLAGGFLLPEEVAHAAIYLLSDESRHVTGQVLAVDGGWSVVAGSPDAR
jgi:NAD(P)-dependent dehydrogenase (short-subunit alcohol dehydrogenase family)